MPRTMWEWLEIEETTDKTLIKKAYARQSKRYHPEDFPKEAQKLREAYKKAMALASAHRAPSALGEANFSVEGYLHILHGNLTASEEQETPDYSKEDYLYNPQPGHSDEEAVTSDRFGKDYQYSFRTDSLTDGKGEESSYRYDGFHMEPAKAERIFKLAGQLVFLHESSDYRRVPKIWKMVLESHFVQEDLKDPVVIAELVSVIEQMPYLESAVWQVLQMELFRYSDNSAVWLRLKDRFKTAQQTIDAKLLARINRNHSKQFTSSLMLRVSRELYGTGSKLYKKYRFRTFCIAALIVTPGILALLLAAVVNLNLDKQTEEKRQQEIVDSWRKEIAMINSLNEQYENSQKIKVSSFIVESFQKTYTKERPYEIDLNNDEIPDHVYYDSEEGFFMTELYDFYSGTYYLYGTVNQYLENNPDMYHVGFMACFVSDAALQ